MEEIIKLINSDVPAALKLLTANSKDQGRIKALIEEYKDIKREERETQIGKIQKDKIVGKGEKTTVVKPVKIPIPFQNRIVTTATAFEVGASVTITPSEVNKLSEEINILWKNNRIDSKIQKLKILQKSELQCALLFHIKDIKPENIFNRILGINNKKEIKVKVLENKNGKMTPYFDSFGDMKFFVWEFSDKNEAGKEVKKAFIYDDKNVYECSDSSGSMSLDNANIHGFGKIPIVYLEQDNPEWHIAQNMIDRLEVAISKLGNSNDYTGHPILKIYGEVTGAPGKDEDGKAFHFPMKKDQDGKWQHGDVEFLTYAQAPESVKLEMDRLEKYIYSLTSTPDISFDNIKGLGNVSGVAIKLMFLDAIIKAKMNEGQNRTIIERIVNVFIAGNVNTTNVSLKSLASKTFFDVVFNSIIPDDLKNIIETLSQGKTAGLISTKTGVELLDLTNNSEEEIQRIKENEPVVKQQVKNLI
ncbi:phage portal protein [Aquimarina macrocephali]|uniref:phage portal protein n=1 Tax=Aquimarina macrocephali TaxID=666563 RepID=UPI003F6789AB